ncbi:MAG TPA: TRAP transporter large permease, partial [Comamonadaceae bacterium]|nr:TRAP transporter large permease [Comamonadaceae bacterium]
MAQMGLIAAVFVVLLVGGMWIPFAIALTSVLYILMASGWAGLQGLGLVSWGSTYSFTLTAIPLFVLMAELMLESGLSQRVYRGMSYLVRPLPGGLLQTNVAGCAAFSAISGSSVATAAAVGSIAIPQLRSRGYDNPLAAGTLVAGGTLGILIPPSIAMIIYGTFTDTSIAKLFMAGVVPG